MHWRRLLVSAALISLAHADEMDMPDVEFHPINPVSKSFHWVLSVSILLLVLSAAAALAFANKFRIAIAIHIVVLVYAVIDVLFLPFPDSEGHENATSKGSAWSVAWILGGTVFCGTVVNGTNLIINRWRKHGSMEPLTPSRVVIRAYKSLACLAVIAGWVRVCLAPVALFGFCYGRLTGQCIAHGIMGLAFVLYGFVLAWVLVVPWIRNHHLHGEVGKSQEFWDSTLMCLWGIVNTFTEHRWGREGWSHGDYQHTSMGIVWWCGGLLGMWLSRKNGVRSVIPALILIYTGYAMAEHSQHLAISTKVHAMFGMVLMCGGVARIIEICFLLQDAAGSALGRILLFQHFPPLCLVMAGILFMSANEEQLQLVHDLGADHSSYILVVTSAGFMVYLWMCCLLGFYLRLVGYDENGELGNAYASVEAVQDFELDDLSDA